MEAITKMRVYDPRAETDPNSSELGSIMVDVNLEDFKKSNDKVDDVKEIKIGKLYLSGEVKDNKMSLSQNRTVL